MAIFSKDPSLVNLVRQFHDNLTQASLLNMDKKRTKHLQQI